MMTKSVVMPDRPKQIFSENTFVLKLVSIKM